MTPPYTPAPKTLPDDLYVKRNLAIDDFVEWTNGSSDSTRLRSVVGPPGCGKTTFIGRLHDRLLASGCAVLWLDLQRLGEQAPSLPASLRPGRVVLFVDGFEDVTMVMREAIQAQVLVHFLFPPGQTADDRYAVITRRDEYGLKEALLRWEEEVYVLDGLDKVVPDGPTQQIRQRLAAIAGDRMNAIDILAWEAEDGQLPAAALDFVGGLDDAGRDVFCADFDLPNPYLNLALLRQRLRHWLEPLADADYHAALTSYARRARLEDTYFTMLADLVPRLDNHGELSLKEYQAAGKAAAELEAFMAAGIIAQPCPNRFRVEPAICKIVSRLSNTTSTS